MAQRKKRQVTSTQKKSHKKDISYIPSAQGAGITTYARNSYKWAESYTSLLMGIVVVIILVLFTAAFIRETHHIQDTTSTSIGPTSTPSVAPGHDTMRGKEK